MLWSPIYLWLTTAVPGVNVIKRDQNGRLPDRPFITAKVTAQSREGHSSVGPIDANGVCVIQQGVLLTVGVRTFGNIEQDNAFEMASAVNDSLERVTTQNLLRSNGLAFVRVLTGPTDLATVVGTGFEAQSALDVQMRTSIALTDDVGIIERVELTGDVEVATFTGIIGV